MLFSKYLVPNSLKLEYADSIVLSRDSKKVFLYNKAKVVYGDILDPSTYQDYLATCDVVVHTAAAVQINDVEINWKTNFEGTKHLVNAINEYGIKRLIHTVD